MTVTLDASAIIMSVVGLAFTLLGGVVVYFLRGIYAEFRRVGATVGEHTTELAVLRTQIDTAKADIQSMKDRQQDFGQFLQTLGFQLREELREKRGGGT